MKKKTIYVVIAIAVVAILAIGFQTAPKTPAFDFESNPIVDVVTINTEEAGTLVFSGVPAFFVTIVLLVQCSTAYNVHHFEPLFHQFHGGFQFVQSLMIIDPVSRVFGHMTH